MQWSIVTATCDLSEWDFEPNLPPAYFQTHSWRRWRRIGPGWRSRASWRQTRRRGGARRRITPTSSAWRDPLDSSTLIDMKINFMYKETTLKWCMKQDPCPLGKLKQKFMLNPFEAFWLVFSIIKEPIKVFSARVAYLIYTEYVFIGSAPSWYIDSCKGYLLLISFEYKTVIFYKRYLCSTSTKYTFID